MLSRRPVDIRNPPADLDGLVDWFDRVSANLVLLEPYDREQVRLAVEAMERGMRAHLARAARGGSTSDGPESRLQGDHARFVVSIDQLQWFFRIVDRDDHGGNRQALGQYGRVLTEALRRHLADERSAGSTGVSPSAGRR
jgi:hypothetical protein